MTDAVATSAARGSTRVPVILLPGAVMPAEPAYSALIEALGQDVDAVAKDLELYAGDEPPPAYSLDNEVDGITRAAAQAGFEQFHLVGYSGGGASTLAFVASHPERVLSLALFEPAWAGNDELASEETALWAQFAEVMRLPPPQRMPAFVRLQLAPGVVPPAPPPGPPPPWMAKRPAGVAALLRAFASYDLHLENLRTFTRPVLYGIGGLSNPDYFARQAVRLAPLFSDFTIEVYEERHHFDPPHRAEPDRVAADLRRRWAAGSSSAQRPN